MRDTDAAPHRESTVPTSGGPSHTELFTAAQNRIAELLDADSAAVAQHQGTQQGLTETTRRQTALANEHSALAGGLARRVQHDLSGSNRAWEALTALHRSGPIDPIVPGSSFTGSRAQIETGPVDDASNRAIQARDALDRPLFFIKSQHEALTHHLRFIEGTRRGCIDQAHALAADLAAHTDRAQQELAAQRRSLSSQRTALISRGRELDAEHWGAYRQACTPEAPAEVLDWAHPAWTEFEPIEATGPTGYVAGTLHPAHRTESLDAHRTEESAEAEAVVRSQFSPLILSGTWDRAQTIAFTDGNRRQDQESFVRAFLTRQLAAFPPGTLRLGLADPIGVGQSFAPFVQLADHSQELLSGKVRSSQEDILDLLTSTADHIVNVVQTYLRQDYDTLREYNEAAGEIAEPYRLLVLLDFPHRIDERMMDPLRTILDRGPRCGVFTLITTTGEPQDESGYHTRVRYADLPHQSLFSLDGLTLEFEGLRVPLHLDTGGDDPVRTLGEEDGFAVINRVVDAVGRGARGRAVATAWPDTLIQYERVLQADTRSDLVSGTRVPVPADPRTWWRNSAAPALAAPLGRAGARDVALLTLDSGDHAGALLVGRPGSGKSTLIHTLLAGLTTLYSPAELELHLLDFKEGVEFQAYADADLPHARCVAVESEREFGLSVLKSVAEEMRRRAELFKQARPSVTNYADYRAQGHEMPRVLLVFDEFQMLFTADDRLGMEAAQLLEQIIRQGRGLGVHLLLSSQSLSGMPAIGRQVLQMVGVRILLPASPEDGAMVLGDRNSALRSTYKRGEGVLNPDAGADASNARFLTAFEPEEDRLTRLARLRETADAHGFTRRPQVFHSDVESHLDEEPRETFLARLTARQPGDPTRLALAPGHALRLTADFRALLPREAGSNAALVSRSADAKAVGFAVSAAASVLAGEPHSRLRLITFTQQTPTLQELSRMLQDSGRAQVHAPRQLTEVLGELAEELTRRQEEFDRNARTEVLMLHGVHRARDLDSTVYVPHDPEAAAPPTQTLEALLRDGPEVGIHTILWADTVPNLLRSITRDSAKDIAHRFFTAMSPEDLASYTGAHGAFTLRENQMAYVNTDTQESEKFSPYLVRDARTIGSLIDGTDQPVAAGAHQEGQ
ncbi:FtsK/SpoIIIE domain-containing protein [Brevibacterium album]|uniref:FtsK/SpoIIIE domain-containing protein n=1 Tax=Brevibacterium album TaxID=417948 RepID=UPI0003F9A925|nr:FtsK/SpoIIIE domain-containing protein [Brevibacterium album]